MDTAPLPSAACPWCGTSTQVGDKYIGTGKRQVSFVFCDESRCSAIGPARNNEALDVIAWNEIAAPILDRNEAHIILRAGLDTAIRCGDTQREKIQQLRKAPEWIAQQRCERMTVDFVDEWACRNSGDCITEWCLPCYARQALASDQEPTDE